MHFVNPIIIGLLVANIVLLGGLLLYREVHRNKRQAIFEDQRPESPFRPRHKLDTQSLMRVPHMFFPGSKRFARRYAIRKNYVVVFDDDGDAWVGPLMPLTIYQLVNFKYMRDENCTVPIRGEGEKFAGDPIVVDDFTIRIYPQWIGRKSSYGDLAFWAFLEKMHAYTYAGGTKSIEDDFRGLKLLPFER